ncbi:TIGR02680 family protein [Nocardioides kribbensis]|uniref:TIGR02680 family protein n=1 Tax=Nocardioides kribbensis TaxID=305517 RepID=UPI00187AB614|nr:TIGR02680 family protein [Nocardioides kribbensis]
MTSTATPVDGLDSDHQTPPRHHPYRWRMHRAGLVDVWFYYDTEFEFSGGRLILRGTNGSGKSRALELLLPFVLDADRRKMDATGSGKVSLLELMKAGADDRTTRAGYLWLELARTVDQADPADAELHAAGATEQYLTIGVHLRFSRSTGEVKPHYFITDRRVGVDLELLSRTRETLPREKLAELIGADRLTTSPSTHRDRVRAAVFTLTGDSGAERYAGLLQLLHTLRSPDVGNRIDEGRLPQILSDALPPLNETALNSAGEQLDGLSETRAAQTRLEAALAHVNAFLGTYRRYAGTAVAETADQASAAAAAAEGAVKDAADWVSKRDSLEAEHGRQTARATELAETIAELEATISGIQSSPAYKDARDLDEREEKVNALGSAADIALRAAETARGAEAREAGAARSAVERVVGAAGRAAAVLEELRGRVEASGVAGTLPTAIAASVVAGSPVNETVRAEREGDAVAFDRPVPQVVAVTPGDLAAASSQLALVQANAKGRGQQARGRLEKARSLAAERANVERAESDTRAAEERAREADEAEVERQGDLDQSAVAYAEHWRDWVASSATVAAFDGAPDLTGTVVDAVLADPSVLVVDLDGDGLAELDRVAEGLVQRASVRHVRTIAELDAADAEAAAVRGALEAERRQLESAVDPSPAAPAWLRDAGDGAVPLWRTVDFAEDLPETERAGLEGALLASGLLLATVHADGALRAEDGQLLLTLNGPAAAESVAGKVVADPASPVRVDVVEAVLSRIGYGHVADDRRSGAPGVWVAPDGSWGAGPLNGRHVPTTARHIGAAARAEARRVRLAAIATELADLADAEQAREAARTEAEAAIARLSEVTRSAPVTQPVATARVRAADATRLAARERASAHAAARQAAEMRSAWSRANAEHGTICSEFGLPHGADDLDEVRRACDEAASSCNRVVERLADLSKAVDAHTEALGRVEDRAAERRDAEELADREWAVWHREAAELASTRTNIGRAAAAAKAELRDCKKAHTELANELKQVSGEVSRLEGDLGAAKVEARNAAAGVTDTHNKLVDAVDRLRRRLALPGIAAAAFTDTPVPLELAEVTPAAVRRAVAQVTGNLRRHAQAVDENGLIRPQQNLERELSGTYDVIPEVRDGIRLVELSDATGRRTVAEAAGELERTVEEGRNALSERERKVFTEFVLGGVAEELRRRLDQAAELIEAMNASLSTIQTSHGIGVKLRWKVADTSDPTVARIKELVATAGAVRSVEQTAELTELLKARVDEAFALDESAGYATHLREALDYRAWHQVEVIILGPNPEQERRISRKARLSQGETRFVSYVTLFAAIDAYLSGLPDTGRALRLLLLDDAFAKVDDRTIGELMGLLVRLDVDFAMTGHALWGTYPQVPSLDCYEVRRVEGTAAVTTHMHWDGHTRHLRAAR